MNWQPIETAPKDGTAVLISIPRNLGEVRVGVWHGWNGGGEWLTLPGRYAVKPTHWMQLPKPPVGPEGA